MPRREFRRGAARARSARGSRRPPASAGPPTRSAARLPRREPGPSRRIALSLPSILSSFRCRLACSGRFARREQALVLTLLPLDPGRRLVLEDGNLSAGEPGLESGAKVGIAPKPNCERDVVELHAEALPEIGERAELVQLASAVAAGSGGGGVPEGETRGPPVGGAGGA